MAPSDLKPWADNPRNITAAAVQRIVDLITRFGFGAPLVARAADHEIIAGHTRHKAALQLGLGAVPVRLLDISAHDAHVLALADNRSTELTGWTDNLAELLERLPKPDLAVAGWDGSDLNKLLADMQRRQAGTAVQDEVPAPPKHPITKLGDVWLLGKHRLVCGDSRDKAVVAQVLRAAKPPLMVTDPPYGVAYDANWRNEDIHYYKNRRLGKVKNDDRADWRLSYQHFPGAIAYVWHGAIFASVVDADLKTCGLLPRAQIIWNKSCHAVSRGAYHWKHEPCWYAVREGETAQWVGDRKQVTVWDIDLVDRKDSTEHSTQKPVECMARPMRNHCGKGIGVYDPFLGSGTTLIAAEQLERVCYGIELSPAYCDVIVERWQQFTHGKAQRETRSKKGA